jgi:hypothetical protein
MTSLRFNLRPRGTYSAEFGGLRMNMKILSSCGPQNPLARHFHKVLSRYKKLVESSAAAQYATTQAHGRELFATSYSQPTQSSWRDPTSATASSPSLPFWPTMAWSSASSHPFLSSYEAMSEPETDVPSSTELRQAALMGNSQPALFDPALYLGWDGPLQRASTNVSISTMDNSSSEPRSVDTDLEHYKPYMGNLAPVDAFEI